MNPTIEGFAEFHGLKGVTMLDEYIKSLRGSDDLCETMENMKPFLKTKSIRVSGK